MERVKKKLEEMLSDEENAQYEYVELANELYDAGVTKTDAVKLIEIASDERRHFKILKEIYKKL